MLSAGKVVWVTAVQRGENDPAALPDQGNCGACPDERLRYQLLDPAVALMSDDVRTARFVDSTWLLAVVSRGLGRFAFQTFEMKGC
eukprot:s2094_g7.t1